MERVEMDPREGGQFLIVEKRGAVLAEHFGTFVKIERPKLLVFSFATDREHPPTPVTVEIRPAPGGSELVLTHELAPQWADFKDRAQAGWSMILDGLARTL